MTDEIEKAARGWMTKEQASRAYSIETANQFEYAKSWEEVEIIFLAGAAWAEQRMNERVAQLVEALESIAAFNGKTLLHDCCVNEFCTPVPGEAHCTHQLGVSRGFNECAGEASTALKAWRGE